MPIICGATSFGGISRLNFYFFGRGQQKKAHEIAIYYSVGTCSAQIWREEIKRGKDQNEARAKR